MTPRTRWIAGTAVALLVLLVGYVVAGPWLAINGIRNLVADGEYGQLWRFVDFEQLRQSLKPQIQRRIAGGVAGRMGTGDVSEAVGGVTALIAEPAIDAMVSPVGIATLLHGSALAKRASGQRDADGKVRLQDPLRDAKTRYQSPSLFTATVPSDTGKPVVFEFRRSGLVWKLAGIRLPD